MQQLKQEKKLLVKRIKSTRAELARQKDQFKTVDRNFLAYRKKRSKVVVARQQLCGVVQGVLHELERSHPSKLAEDAKLSHLTLAELLDFSNAELSKLKDQIEPGSLLRLSCRGGGGGGGGGGKGDESSSAASLASSAAASAPVSELSDINNLFASLLKSSWELRDRMNSYTEHVERLMRESVDLQKQASSRKVD